MALKFEIHKSTAAQPYRVKIVASNGQTLAVTENYAAKASAKNAAESIIKGAAEAKIVDLTGEG